jgi:hypothetical protein
MMILCYQVKVYIRAKTDQEIHPVCFLFLGNPAEGGGMMARDMLYIDTSELEAAAEQMKRMLSEDKAKRMLRDTISNTGRKVKSILGKEIPRKYEAKRNWVTSQVGKPQHGEGGGDLSAIIPIRGVRGVAGGRFPAKGGVKGRSGRAAVKLLKGRYSALPAAMTHQGGQPPFRNPGSKLGNVVFTRKTSHPLPIVRVAGLSVPQMPMNRSRDDVTNEIIEYMDKELERNFQRMLK